MPSSKVSCGYHGCCILVVGLVVEGSIVVLAIAVHCPKLFPRQFAKIAQFSMNWIVRTIVSLVLIYSPMAIVIFTLTQCYGSTQLQEDFYYVQMVFYITVVVLICSISFMQRVVSYIVKLVASLLSAILTLVLVITVHFRCLHSSYLQRHCYSCSSYGSKQIICFTR